MSIQPENQLIHASSPELSMLSALHKKYEAFSIPISERRVLLMFVDIMLSLFAVFGASILWQKTAGSSLNISYIFEHRYWFLLLTGGWESLAWLNDLYDLKTANQKGLSAARVIIVSLLTFSLYLLVYFFYPYSLPRLFVIYFLFIVTPAIVLWRATYVAVFNAIPFEYRVLIIGGNKRGQTIANILNQEPSSNYKVIGFVDNNIFSPGKTAEGVPVLGYEKDTLSLVKHFRVHEVIVAIEHNLDKNLFLSLVECQAAGVRVSWMPDLYEKLCQRVPIEHVDPAWALSAMQDRPLFSRLQIIAKRLFDLTLFMFGAPIVLFLIPFIALAIRLDSPGPIFYRQIRSGRAGQPFYIYKFRTMVNDAEKDGKAQWAKKNDSRITRIGHLLRKSRLDELPQLLNVMRGEMSIVGPRPERPEFVEQLESEIPFYRTRLLVKPGITGWAQVHHGYGNTVTDALIKLQYDFYYIRYQSLALDIYTMFRTVGVLLRLKGT